jgi:FtsH-binding integral membrane protein
MAMLKLAIAVGFLLAAARGIQLFGRHCRQRFGRSVFTVRGFWLAIIAINLVWWGYYAWATAPLHQAPAFGGLILILVGVAAVARLIRENVRNTNVLYGVGGSLLQLVLFFPVALYGIPLLVIALIFLLFATYKGAPAWLLGR